MRLKWQCPTCFAELGDKSYAKMSVCPYCGSLLIVDKERKKFYLAKHESGWYFFRKKYIGEYAGYVKLSDMEIYFLSKDGAWSATIEGKKYKIIEIENCKQPELESMELEEIWGDVPILLMPNMDIKMKKSERICISTSRGAYALEPIQ